MEGSKAFQRIDCFNPSDEVIERDFKSGRLSKYHLAGFQLIPDVYDDAYLVVYKRRLKSGKSFVPNKILISRLPQPVLEEVLKVKQMSTIGGLLTAWKQDASKLFDYSGLTNLIHFVKSVTPKTKVRMA